MDKVSVQQKSLKQAKARKKPVRVVYISNPMRVKATASQFKGLVQELTGCYSDIADHSKFSHPESAGEAEAPAYDGYLVPTSRPGPDNEDLRSHPSQRRQQHGANYCNGVGNDPFDVYGEVFTPLVLEKLETSFMPGSPSYEPSPLVGNIRRLDIA